jgi:hypothetical protein
MSWLPDSWDGFDSAVAMSVGDETGADVGSAVDGAATGNGLNCPQLVRTNVATNASVTRVKCDLFMEFFLSQRHLLGAAQGEKIQDGRSVLGISRAKFDSTSLLV